MSYILSDKCTVKNVSKDSTFKNETITTTTLNVKCCIQSVSNKIINMQGNSVNTTKPMLSIYFSHKTDIDEGDYIQITKIHGKVLTGQVEKKVKKVFFNGLFSTDYKLVVT